MKVIILAGGLPSTLIEEDEKMPKPMAEIGGRPLLWHIMKQYAHYGFDDFIICTGYKGEVIKNYFMNFYIYQSDITVDLQTNDIHIHRKHTEDWKVSVVDTGLQSSVTERLLMVRSLAGDEPVLVAYGDCLSDMDIQELVAFHKKQKAVATVAVAHPTGRNEILALDEQGCYTGMQGDARQRHAWVNACSMVFEPQAFDIIENGQKLHPGWQFLDCLAEQDKVATYKHRGFWSPVETIRDKTWMETMWAEHRAPWKVWED